jgi:hypothetical protein
MSRSSPGYGAVLSVWSLSTMPSRRPPSSLARRFLRSREDPRPSSSSSSKAYSMTSLTNIATPSGPQTTASPSSVNDLARSRAAQAIAG